MYLASALISPSGYAHDVQLLSTIAKRHHLPVLLVNHMSITGGWQTCGNSGAWNSLGELTLVVNATQPGIVLCKINQGVVSGRVEVLKR